MAQSSPLFPFVLPWDDAAPGVTNLSAWLHKPAGKFGRVRAGADGHYYVGNQRMRFFGVNVCFGGAFPRKEHAEKIAARMAKFGINVVRFHHLDMQTFPSGIRARNVAHTRDFDPEALDRLDYFIAQLKRNGIYVNLNLLVSRPFNAADGLPAEIESIGWKERHIVGFFYAPALELQKEYARKLLTHRNPYTGLTYAEDPAVAFVEINNENGLIHAWLGNDVDTLPRVFLSDLQQQWNAWLRRRYGTTDKLRQAWGVRQEALGAELLVNNDFARGTERWTLEQHERAKVTVTFSEDVPPSLRGTKSARIVVTQTSSQAWHVQFNQPGLKVQAERPYTLTFWAKADKPLNISVNVGQAHEPWQQLGFSASITLTTEWKPFRFVFNLNQSDDNARVNFSDLAQQTASVWLAGVSFRPGGVVGLDASERIENGSVSLFQRSRSGERTAEAQRDWLRFLWETEDNYWQAMYRTLKDDLKVGSVVFGTIVGCSTPNLQAKLDAIDTHAYWQHPHFPSRPWDPEDWIVYNRTMVNEAGGTLPGLALRRVVGKPHNVTEYNHPAPNTFGSEGFLLLAAYGALQDWDAIYAFSYCHRSDDWDARRIPNFFDIDQHPTKMVTLPVAVAMFVRGDVKPAQQQVVVPLNQETEVDALRRSSAWQLVHAGSVGVPGVTALRHRVALATGSAAQTAQARPVAPMDSPRYVADTGELVWDLSHKGRGVITVNTPKSKAVIGYGGGKRFDLSGVIIEPGATLQDGWCTVSVTAMEGDMTAGNSRLLITATGYAENTNMGWKSAERNSVGRNWGSPPSLVEGVSARITLPLSAARVQAWALDERGQRRTPVPVQATPDGKALITIGAQWKTLWYEVETR
ncbi:MAG: carbohydrate binding domain-containing protein [Abditibacteriales bacterium]|nr:carbohydrate binding domain-containing protein [Abditibacteriales bacterium]MDW8367012.1 carbohydrate binding domain-containing protein [Abditibacteriales bacterium]